MGSPVCLGLALLLASISGATNLIIPLEVEQPPTITWHTPGPVTALPLDDSITMGCEAVGNPPPEYRWTKDGEDFTPPYPSAVKTQQHNGSFTLRYGQLAKLQGKYRCHASNQLGTAMTEEIKLMVPSLPKFPKEKLEPVVVAEGDPVVLRCDPPWGIPPRQLYWMSIDLQHIEQDERVSMGMDGNLYFSNVVLNDSRPDYCCFAAFSKIRTIVQKTPMAVVVNALKPTGDVENSTSHSISPAGRMPSLLLPPGVQSEVVLLKGTELGLECAPQGFPTPKVQWIKMGEPLPERTQVKNYGKLLTISDVEDKDNGKYMCKAKNTVGEVVHYFDVIVEEPPKWLTDPPPNQLAVVGSDVHIKCSVDGKPQPDIQWRRNGEVLDDDPSNHILVLDDTVVLNNAREEHSGVYQCEVSNIHGSILANTNIMVMNLAPRMLTRDHQAYAVVLGGDVVMNCSVFGSPVPLISWAKKEALKPGEGEPFGVLPNGWLHISGAEKTDAGEYVCSASSDEGESAITATLHVKDPTKITTAPQDLRISVGSAARLRCHAQYDPTLASSFQVIWSRDGEDIIMEAPRISVEDGVLQIMSVNQSDQGTYTCTARTHLDEDAASALLTVLDVPDAPQNLDLNWEMSGGRTVALSWEPGSDNNSPVTEFLVEFEESHWEPGRWRTLHRVPGNRATAELTLHGNLHYQFRVYAVNAVGPGPPSAPTHRYSTTPAAPDGNPENIKIQGHLPHQMDISWEPLLPVEHNGPGLEYKVSYRHLGVDDSWNETLVKRHHFVVKNTPTFVPYEIKIQSRNSHGWGPEPRVVTGYSGEDVPTAAPRDVAVELVHAKLLRVSWTPVALSTVRGHLGGYNVHWMRRRSLLHHHWVPDERNSLAFLGNRSQAAVPGLRPFSEYTLTVNVFNRKGKGPSSDPVTFHTPEGVPEQVPIVTASNALEDSISLVWGPPPETNGVLTGYLLRYQLVNATEREVEDPREVNISGADTTQWLLRGLQGGALYRFQLSACTRAGCGPPRAQEAHAPARLVPGLLNISSYVSDTFAKISWIPRAEQQDSQLYVAYRNNREGIWRISEAVNTSQSFHVIKGLEPATVYTVRLLAKRLVDNASIFEDVIQTRVKGQTSQHDSLSTQGWFIGTMCGVVLLTLTVLIACFIKRNKGGKYAGTPPPRQRPDASPGDKVKEKEDLHPDAQSQDVNDDTCEYSDSDEKPLKAGIQDDMGGDSISRDSLVDYADGGAEFDEDGSFIGEYSAYKQQGSTGESNGPGLVSA